MLSLVGIALFVSVSIAVFVSYSVRETIKHDVSSHLISVQSIQTHRVETFVKHVEDRLNLISSRTQLRISLRDYLKEGGQTKVDKITRILRDAISTISSDHSVSIYDPTGIFVASTHGWKIDSGSRLEENEYRKISAFILRSNGLDEKKQLLLKAYIPIIFDEDLLGFLVADFSGNELYEIASDYAGLGVTGETLIAEILDNGDSRYLTPLRFDAHAAYRRVVPSSDHRSPIIHAVYGRSEFHDALMDYRGEEVFSSSVFIPETNWGVSVKIDRTEANKPFYDLLYLLVAIVVGTTLFSVLLSYWLARGITRPIDHLTRVARSLKKGERNLNIVHEMARDIETTQLSEALENIISELLETFDSAANGMLIINSDGKIQRVNSALCDMFGFKPREVVGKPIEVLMPSDIRNKHVGLRNGFIAQPVSRPMGEGTKLLAQRKNGDYFPVEIGLSPIDNTEGVTVLATVMDVSRQVEYENMLKKEANYDSLTSLPNRRFFTDILNLELHKSERKNTPLWLLFIDLDGFKAINDNLGHDSGDELLVTVATRLRSAVREFDVVARLGGDEFVILISDEQGKEHISKISASLIRACNQPIPLGKNVVEITLSIGIANYPNDAENTTQLLKLADEAMYKVKSEGKNNFSFFDGSRLSS